MVKYSGANGLGTYLPSPRPACARLVLHIPQQARAPPPNSYLVLALHIPQLAKHTGKGMRVIAGPCHETQPDGVRLVLMNPLGGGSERGEGGMYGGATCHEMKADGLLESTYLVPGDPEGGRRWGTRGERGSTSPPTFNGRPNSN